MHNLLQQAHEFSLFQSYMKLAANYKCRCIEVSAILNHKVDDLLVGMLKQIQGRYDVMTAQSADGDTYDDDDDVDGGRCSSKCADD